MVVVVAWEGVGWGRGHGPFSGASRSGMAGGQLTTCRGGPASAASRRNSVQETPRGDPPRVVPASSASTTGGPECTFLFCLRSGHS